MKTELRLVGGTCVCWGFEHALLLCVRAVAPKAGFRPDLGLADNVRLKAEQDGAQFSLYMSLLSFNGNV